jgi:hypothetical protein
MRNPNQSKHQNKNDASYLDFLNSGKDLAKQGKFAEAIKAYEIAIKLNPNYVWTYFDLGKAHSKLGNLEGAKKAYEKAIELKPDYIWSHNFLGDILSKKGFYLSARKYYRKALKIELKRKFDIYRKSDEFSGLFGIAKRYLHKAAKIGSIRKFSKFWQSDNLLEINFMIIGFAKCGTTSLYEYLIQHPHILPSAKKEPMFFSENFHYGFDWYLAHFPSIPKGQKYITGEASAHYIDHPIAYKRIYENFPNTKLIILLRNPIERTYSDYQMWKRLGVIHRPFKDVIISEMDRVQGEAQATYNEREGFAAPSFISSSLYVYSIKRWMALFPRNQFLILKTEELNSNTEELLSKVFYHLNLNDFSIKKYSKHNVGEYNSINPELRGILGEYFKPHNKLLEDFLGMEFGWD